MSHCAATDGVKSDIDSGRTETDEMHNFID